MKYLNFVFILFLMYVVPQVKSQSISYQEINDTIILRGISNVRSLQMISNQKIYLTDTFDYKIDTLYLNVSKIPIGTYIIYFYKDNFVFFDYITVLKTTEEKKELKKFPIFKPKEEAVTCEEITKTIDEFTDDVTFEIKLLSKSKTSWVEFIKIKDKLGVSYYLSIYIKSFDYYRGEGVILLLDGGKKINKPSQKVEATILGSDFYMRSFIPLNQNDILLLKQYGLQKFKLYISDDELKESPENVKLLFNCLIDSK
jgi:hypothetical protein